MFLRFFLLGLRKILQNHFSIVQLTIRLIHFYHVSVTVKQLDFPCGARGSISERIKRKDTVLHLDISVCV